MNDFRLLQLFADGGDGAGTGAAPGGASEAAAPAGESMESRLEALGVPKDKIRRRSKAGKQSEAAQQAAAAAEPEGQADAAQGAEAPSEETEAAGTAAETGKKPTWDELMQDPDYNQEMQRIVKERLKASKAAQEQMNKLAPALEVLSRFYGVEATDLDALAAAVNDDDRLYEAKADELGIPAQVAKRMDQLERQEQRHTAQQAAQEQEQRIAEHLQELRRQETELQKTFPAFNLQQELNNPVFRRMTAPGSGLSVADAYYAVHRAEIQAAAAQVTAQKVAEKLSNSIQSNARRPSEAGASAQAPTVSTFDYTKMTRQQREDLKRRIHEAAAQGRKLYPGQ